MADLEEAGAPSALLPGNGDAVPASSNQENADPSDERSLRKMFQQGTEEIATHRTDNLFTEQRTLTDEEQKIIQQRVALQRKMFEEYERRELRRKVAELQEVCPDCSTQEAEKALELCDGREDEAAAQLVSDPGFARRVKVACGLIAAPPAAAVARKEPAAGRQQGGPTRPSAPRPRLIDPATLAGNVFVGAFRGKGFKPPPKGRATAKKAVAAASSGSGEEEEEAEEEQEDEETETEGEAEQEEGEEQQEQAAAPADGDAVQQTDAAGAAAVAEPQRYVLVKADTLEAPTDSLLRSARRQLGEPSDSRAGADGQPTPASAARSRPLAPAAEGAAVGADLAAAAPAPMPNGTMLAAMAKQLAKTDDGKAKALLQRMLSDDVRAAVLERLESMDPARAASCRALLAAPAAAEAKHAEVAGADTAPAEEQQQQQQQQEVEDAQQQAAPALATQQRGRGSRRAAAVKRPASAELSAGEDTEEETASEASSEEAESSGDDDFAAPTSSRRRAPTAQVKPREARPSRAAKNAAAATFAAYAVAESGGESSDAEMAAEFSEVDEEAPQRQRRSAAKRGGGRAKQASPPAQAAGKKAAPPKKKQKVAQGAATAPAPEAQPAEAMETSRAEEPSAEQTTSQQGGQTAAQQQQQQPSRQASPGAEEADEAGGSRPQPMLPRVRAISTTGHTCRGRVRQKSHKSADLVEAGTLRADKGWYNAGYIFAEGFQSRTLFRSSVAIDQLCVHECHIIGKGGMYWPQPTFKVVALDRPDEPLIAKSCTGCWTGILKRINAEIEARRKAGEDLPPPPKTAIAGPEYFGLNQPNIQEAVEALDPDYLCTEYWAGKQDRQRAAEGLPVAAGAAAAAPRAPRAPRPPGGSSKRNGGGGGGSSKGRGRRRGSDSEDEAGDEEGEEGDETQFMTNKWSAVSRSERYRNRLQENGEDTSLLDQDNPLPAFIDPITMGPVVRPAISPFGYVAGLATWKVVLAEKQQCPFTNQPLQFEQLKVLTKTNIHLHRDKIVNGTTTQAAAP